MPHTKQREIVANKARRVVICSGRRSGKTTLAAIVACEKLRDGRRVLLASTTQEQADAFWDKCKAWLHALVDAGIVIKNEQRRILTMPGTGGRIKVKTASDADTLRGDYADFLVLDECALLAPDAWEKVGAPMLLDNDGDAWFISTPRRRNWFFHLYQKAMADESGRWKAWHFTSYDNPHLSQAALAELTGDMTDEDIRQEIKAEFLEGQGAVFRNIDACLHAPVGSTPADHDGHEFVMGVDWAQVKDSTVLSVACVTCRCEVALDRFNQQSWDLQRGRVRVLYELWKPYTVLAEENSIGGPNIEALVLEDIPVSRFQTTASSKPKIIKALALSLERADFQWLPDPIAKAELEAYESKVNANTGNTSYSAPDGLHDDTIIARCLALRAASMWSSI
jgi:hypothetical protein